MAINTKKMVWGTAIEMMPRKRSSFCRRKSFDAIYLGPVKNSVDAISVVLKGNTTAQGWHKAFWRQKT